MPEKILRLPEFETNFKEVETRSGIESFEIPVEALITVSVIDIFVVNKQHPRKSHTVNSRIFHSVNSSTFLRKQRHKTLEINY